MQRILEPKNLKSIYDTFKGHTKEKIDMILEPMQVMVQLAILSFSPLGTKISIQDNIIKLQPPTNTQGLERWYNNDSKDDLYYLFKAVIRYYKLYGKKNPTIFDLILNLAKDGLTQLSKTYSNTDKTSIIHTLGLYKALLNSDPTKIFDDKTSEMDDAFQSMTDLYDTKKLNIIFNLLKIIKEEENSDHKAKYIETLTIFFKPTNYKIKAWIQEKIAA